MNIYISQSILEEEACSEHVKGSADLQKRPGLVLVLDQLKGSLKIAFQCSTDFSLLICKHSFLLGHLILNLTGP